jgi:hypothetical protein
MHRFSGGALLLSAVLATPPGLLAQTLPSDHQWLSSLRDSVALVGTAVWEFRRDLRSAGTETVLTRVAHLHARCQAAAVSLKPAEKRIASGTSSLRRATGAFLAAIRALRTSLEQDCLVGLRERGPGEWADTLRAWGPYRGSRIERAIRLYDAESARFAAANGFQLEPPKR